MQRPLSRFNPVRFICATLIVGIMLLSCGLTAFATETTPDTEQTAPPAVTVPLPPYPEDMKDVLYPADVQTVIEDGARQIIKTYILTDGQTPADIPRDSFERGGWRYELTDITEKKTSGTDAKNHTETVKINTSSNNLNTIIGQLAPTLEYQSEDGYYGILTLDLATVKCEAAGYKNSSYTVTATREYPHLSTNDLSLIPKTITDNGQTLQLDDVTWEVQRYVNVDYEDIPESYRAVAKYTANASKSVVTGYVTTADYVGEVSKMVKGDTVYAAYFVGIEIAPTKKPTEPPATTSPTDPTKPATSGNGSVPIVPILFVFGILAALAAGAYAFLFMHRNVKIYRDNFRVLVAKDKISAKSMTIDLTPLDDICFGIEIDKFTAKTLNGKTVEVRHGSGSLKHKIAYEGNTYRIVADFGAGTIQAIYQ